MTRRLIGAAHANRRGRRLLTALSVIALTVGITGGAGANARIAQASSGNNAATADFYQPTAQERPMARMWFPDAGAAETAQGLQMVAQHFQNLAKAGFGGAEIAFLSDNTNYTNADAKTIGFGSPNWQRIVKQILETANSIPGGFKIDLTLTSHWPLAVNNIDPNDPGQQQEATSAYSKITAADLAAGTKDLPLPPLRTRDFSNNAADVADFIFVNTYSAATVAKVVGFNGTTPIFQLASLADASGQTSAKTVTDSQAAAGTPYHVVNGVKYAGYAAGVPDQAYAAAHGINYSTVLAQWGPEPSNPNFSGKIDAEGNRKRMADWQYEYQTSLSGVPALQGYTPSSGDNLAVGDYVLFGTYHQGTGQIMSGGASVTQYNRPYAISLYNQQGTQALTDFWNSKILDPELIALLKQNAAQNPTDAVFEDSYEINHSSPLWTEDLLNQMTSLDGTGAARYAPLLALGATSNFDNADAATRILEDYTSTMGNLFRTYHIGGIEDWASTFDYKYKLQAEAGVTGVHGAEPSVSVIEGDNAASNDGWRNMAGAANVSGSNIVSDEALTFVASDYTTPWSPLVKALNLDWAGGVNRVNFHGSPFAKTFNGYHSAWPGWEFGFGPFGLGVFDARQIYWQDMNQLTNYVARTQAVLQGGTAKVDLALLEGTNDSYTLPGSNSLQTLLDMGYSYNVLDDTMLNLPSATVQNGVLDPSGPAYKALVVSGATELTVASVNKLIEDAQAGLPVIFYNSAITRVFGTNQPNNNDTLLAQRLAVLMATPNVYTASSQEQINTILTGQGIAPAASYSAPGLETLHRRIDGRDYYYLYSAGTTLAAPAAVGDTGLRLASTAGLRAGDKLSIDTGANQETVTIASIPSPAPAAPSPNVLLTAPLTKAHYGAAGGGGFGSGGSASPAGVSTVVNKSISLAGTWQPYMLNAWTGDATPIANYTSSNGTVTVKLTLQAQEAALIETNVPGNAQVTSVANPLNMNVDLSQGWSLQLQSWGPDATADATDPTVSAKTTVSFPANALGSWSSLPATSAQLATLGVTSMSQVSGIGTYTDSFQLPSSWKPDTEGAYLQLAHGSDMVVAVTVNGHTIDTINQITDKVDVGPYLQAGTNTLQVKLDTLLGNRVGKASQSYGLTSVQFQGYILSAVHPGMGASPVFAVSFTSSAPGQGQVYFGSGPGCTGLVEVATQDQGAGTTSHTVVVQGNDLPGTVGDNGLQPGATYWYEMVTVTKSGTETDNNGGKCYSVTLSTT